jgi:hypothetical protein
MRAPSRNTFGRFGVQLSSTMFRARIEKAKMTELTRYLVRMGSKGWMVWDRHARAPARLEGGRPVIELTEEQAREISDELNKNNIADG